MCNPRRFALLLGLAAAALFPVACSKDIIIGAVISESGSVETYGSYV